MPEPEVELTRTSDRNSFRTTHAPGISWLVVILLLVLSAFAVMYFGQDLPPVEPLPSASNGGVTPVIQPRIYTISYDAGVFSPTTLRTHDGDTLILKNESILPMRIVSVDLVGFSIVGDIPQGSYFSYTFAARGTFGYRNSHNNNQTGTIIVK